MVQAMAREAIDTPNSSARATSFFKFRNFIFLHPAILQPVEPLNTQPRTLRYAIQVFAGQETCCQRTPDGGTQAHILIYGQIILLHS